MGGSPTTASTQRRALRAGSQGPAQVRRTRRPQGPMQSKGPEEIGPRALTLTSLVATKLARHQTAGSHP